VNDPGRNDEARSRLPAGRPPRAAGRTEVLSREEILDAALAIANRGELDRLSMRRLAEELHVSAMSLYAHVADKDDILDEIIENRLRGVGLPAKSAGWLDWMAEVAERLRLVLAREPALLDRYCRRPVGVPAAIERMEASLAVLRRAGFSGADAVETFAAVHTYTIGFAALELARQVNDGVPFVAHASPLHTETLGYWPGFFANLEPDDFPQLVELRPDLGAFTGTAQFTTGLESLLAGLAARFLEPSPGRSRERRGGRSG
jgi:AcrR family transcriptional regulator